MIKISDNFVGGNIFVKEQRDNVFILDNDLRDTEGDWFYWAFCVEGAENQTLTFQFSRDLIGYYGPAVSHDLKEWHWLESGDCTSFTYSFSKNEGKVYFAHDMLYHPDRFLKFAEANGLEISELCKGHKGSSVPCTQFGNGEKSIIITARHHACEATGNYAMEGFIEEFLKQPIPNYKVFCVPFVDYDGVVSGDQGKNRHPHDHNRDYWPDKDSIYPECAAIKEYAEKNGCHLGFDFHSPWHKGGQNDEVFIVQSSKKILDRLNRFGEHFEQAINEKSLKYYHASDYPPETGWNMPCSQFSVFMTNREENEMSFTLETSYFGTPENKVNEERLLELGRCFVRALRKYLEK